MASGTYLAVSPFSGGTMDPYSPPPRTKILIAAANSVEERLKHVLTGHDLVLAKSSFDVMLHLSKETYGMVILSVHFDESQMFTLLGDIRGHAKYRKVPLLCVLGDRGSMLSDVAVEGLDHAVKAMTANGFLDLKRFEDSDTGNARIRRIVDYLILIDGDLHNIAQEAADDELRLALERRRSVR